MLRSTVLAVLFAAFVAGVGCLPARATLYGVTLRNRNDAASGGMAGEIYDIDPATGKARRVAALSLASKPVGLRGLAMHPKTHVFYGITAGTDPAFARALVTLDPASGAVAMVGPLGVDASDINFDRDGRLYVWLPGTNALGRVDLGTGHVSAEASSGLADTVGGGFAIGADGAALLSATSAAGTLDTVDLRTGRVKTGPHLMGAPFVTAITAMDFDGNGRLFGVNTNLGEPSRAELITVDKTSGHVTDVGALPDDTTALAFAPDARATSGAQGPFSAQEAGLALIMAVIGAGLGAVAQNRLNRRR